MTSDYKKVGNRVIKKKKGNWNGEINTNEGITSVACVVERFFSEVIKTTSGDSVGILVILLLIILWLAFIQQPKCWV